MNILIGMETSGEIRRAFRDKGHNAWSCDLLKSDDDSLFHYQCDIYKIISDKPKHWFDLIIMHPECTALCVSGNHVYAKGKTKHKMRLDALKFTQKLWDDCLKITGEVCFENPVGVLYTESSLPKPQYIQPYDFGHDASKKTGLFLHGLPMLKKVKYIKPRIVNGKERWANQTDSGQNRLGPSEDRWKLRSKTYTGIARAMAEQWG